MELFDIFIHCFNCFFTVWMNVSEDGDGRVAGSKKNWKEGKLKEKAEGEGLCCVFFSRGSADT